MGNRNCLPEHNFIPPKEIENYEEENPGGEAAYLEGICLLLIANMNFATPSMCILLKSQKVQT